MDEARGPHVLVAPARLDFGERAVVAAFAAPVGDFRDPAARAWAAEIAATLAARRGTDQPVAT